MDECGSVCHIFGMTPSRWAFQSLAEVIAREYIIKCLLHFIGMIPLQ